MRNRYIVVIKEAGSSVLIIIEMSPLLLLDLLLVPTDANDQLSYCDDVHSHVILYFFESSSSYTSTEELLQDHFSLTTKKIFFFFFPEFFFVKI